VTRLTFDPSLDEAPIWSPDGKQILFTSNRKQLGFHFYLKNADGSGFEEEAADFGPGLLANAWTGHATARMHCSGRELSCGTSPGRSA